MIEITVDIWNIFVLSIDTSLVLIKIIRQFHPSIIMRPLSRLKAKALPDIQRGGCISIFSGVMSLKFNTTGYYSLLRITMKNFFYV